MKKCAIVLVLVMALILSLSALPAYSSNGNGARVETLEDCTAIHLPNNNEPQKNADITNPANPNPIIVAGN